MTKKRRSNGFMYFADTRRSVYEAENNGIQISAKTLVDRAARDWKLMTEEQQQKWKTESRRRKQEYQKQVWQMQSISITSKVKSRPPSNLEKALQPKPISFLLTEEERRSLRKILYQKLIWREKENMTESLGKKRFGILTVRPYCSVEASENISNPICPPAEICSYLLSLNDGILEGERSLIWHGYPPGHQFHELLNRNDHGFVEITPREQHIDVDRACLRIASQLRGCWSNIILVPISQYQNLIAGLDWIKQKRDTSLNRNTTSIRLERLVCIEDMLSVIAHIFEVNIDESSEWEQNIPANGQFACSLHENAPEKCPKVVGKVACEHFLNTLREITSHSPPDPKLQSFMSKAPRPPPNPIARPTAVMNPFEAAKYPTTKSGNNTYQLFSVIRKQNPDPIQKVTTWLSHGDINTACSHEYDDSSQIQFENNYSAFAEDIHNDLFGGTHPLRLCQNSRCYQCSRMNVLMK